MKPDIWMPFCGQDFDRSTLGWSRADRWSYWAALWAYWVAGCEGLPNDDGILRRICQCDLPEWGALKGLVFGPKFKIVDGLWHNERAAKEFRLAKANHESAANRGRLGAEARRLAQLEAEPPAEVVAHVKPSPSPLPVPLHTTSTVCVRAPEIPDWKEISKYADMSGVTQESARAFYDHHEGNQLWLNQYGRLIHWQHKLKSWGEQDRTKPSGKSNGINLVVQNDELRRVDRELAELKRLRHPEVGYEPHQRAKLKALKSRQAELREKLGLKA